MNFIDLKGRRFGRLIAQSIHRKAAPGMYLWRCLCDCGKKTIVRGMHLRSGNTTSCGCRKEETLAELPKLTTTHGRSATRTYRIYRAILTRCNNPKNEDHKDYGGRGINVCERWSGTHGFAHFLSDMGEAPPHHTIDRKNVNGNYTPKNCRWATAIQQARNKRTSRWIVWRGQRRCLSEWCELIGWRASRLHKRLRRMPLDEAMAPLRKFL